MQSDYWQRWQQRRFSRRTLLKTTAVAAGGLTVGAVIGCSDNTSTTGKTTTIQARKGGTVTRRNGFETLGVALDPHTGTPTQATVFRLWYNGLLALDPATYDVKSQLAERWEVVSKTEFLFHLRANAKWHNKPPVNGRAFTADDVVSSLNRIRTNDPRFASRSTLETVDKIEAVNPTTVRITLNQPDAGFLAKLAGDAIVMMAPEVTNSAAKYTTAGDIVGTGAFILQDLQPTVSSRSVRNPDYWNPDRPYLDELRTQHFNEDAAAYAAFQAGQIDIANAPTGDDAKRYIASRGSNYQPAWAKQKAVYYLQPNTRVPPFDNPNVTRALRLLIDHKEMIEAWANVYYGRGRHGQFFPGEMESWDLSAEEYEGYLEWKPDKTEAARQANQMLAAAGFTPSSPLNFELTGGFVSPGDAISQQHQLLIAQWKRLSQGAVNATLKLADQPTANQIRANRSFTVMHLGNAGSAQEPDAYLTQILSSKGSRNYAGWADTTFDNMITTQRQEYDLNQRKKLIRDINLYLIEHSPIVIVTNAEMLEAVNPKVHDYTPEYNPFLRGDSWENVWREA